ncbi:hypothetical protein Sjap_001858 [Stephania japonica]|uniref:DEAD-box ATP-dependent RNA helicase 33 n=1 Tax=Stephania japonica TaxID=461633 RepID=A0AAP0KKR8_9MAGN
MTINSEMPLLSVLVAEIATEEELIIKKLADGDVELRLYSCLWMIIGGGVEMWLSAIPQNLSWVKCLSGSHQAVAVQLRLSQVSMRTPTTVIRMGGGPRTYPGGVSKWQWKRMQAKKAKQLLKARLCRERQIYEMRKRAELKAAVSELEKPWEVVERAPKLFSVSADDQLKALADRFQKPGGLDMWSDRDGPQLFPSARFFPKGAVHSIKPYVASPSSSTQISSDDAFGGAKGISSIRRIDAPNDGIRGGRRRRPFPTKSTNEEEEEASPSAPYEMSLRPDGRYEFQS